MPKFFPPQWLPTPVNQRSTRSSAGAHVGTIPALFVLAACVGFTLLVSDAALDDADLIAKAEFDSRVAEITNAIRARMNVYEQVLRGAVGLFHASEIVERDEWRIYVADLQVSENYPGMLAIGYVRRVLPAEKEIHIAEVRAEGFPDYTIQPEGERHEYTSIVYIEPFDETNRRAFGYDMFSDPVRRLAMEQARDRGATAISGKVVLVQEAAKNPSPGVLMYLPLYKKKAAHESVEERRAALQGYVYAPFRMRELMQQIWSEHARDVDLAIYDGEQPGRESLLYSSNEGKPRRGLFASELPIEIEGSTWFLRIDSSPTFEAAIDRQKPVILLLAGLLISFALFAAMLSFAGARARALALANKMTAALRKSEERSRLIVDTAHDAFLAFDSEGRLIDWNQQAEASFGWTREEVLGRALVDTLVPERDREKHREGMRRFLKTGEDWSLNRRLEAIALRRDGREFPVEFSMAALATDGGLVFNLFMHDISERREKEREITSLNADLESRARELESSNKELESFSYSVSHDLRAPLRSVDGFSRILEEDYRDKLDAEGRRVLSVIRASSQKMSHLIDDLLTFSRLGRQALKLSKVDMAALALEARGDLEADFHPLAISVHPMPGAWGDRALLKQIWINLLSNAVKFSQGRDLQKIEAGGRVDGSEHVYYVKDNGVGFDMQYASKLFGVFQRLHSESEFPGTGVGLAIVQRVAARHGGRVWATSELALGATFYFSLPVKENE
ncbi:MAG: CHASE domain-containing sensor histidine kinase [Burkholderiales bacterium]